MNVRTGLEVLLDNPQPIAGKRVGLVTHPSAITGKIEHAIPLLHNSTKWKLTTLYGPEHGMWGEAQDMAHVGDAVDVLTGLRVYSLYGDNVDALAPKREMFDDIDVMIIDLQDIGARYYTFIYTMALCMREAAKAKKRVVVLDRPNPIDGIHIEGNIREDKYASFVGLYPLPVRHGLTIGELAKYFNATLEFDCDVTVVPMEGWKRSMWWDDTGLPWVLPSPNMPTLEAATVYPGMCLIEGTNLSEGRGTTHPFTLFGAPWLDSFKLADAMNDLDLPGIRFRPHYFLPTFQKHAGKTCGGVEMHVTDRETFEPFRTGLWCLKVARDQNPEKFDWRRETYEFVSDRLAIDLLAGSARYREIVESGGDVDEFVNGWEDELQEFDDARQDFLLYRD